MATKLKKRKDGRYQMNIYVGRDENGKKKYKSVFGKTQAETKRKAEEIKIKIGKGIDVMNENMSFDDLCKRWLQYKKPLLKEHLYNSYKIYISHFDSLGKSKIIKLTKSDFQEIINELAEYNPTTGRPTAKETLKKIRSAAFQVFEFAIENRILDFNPVTYVNIPKGSPRKVRRPLTLEEQKWIMTTKHRAQLPAMIMMLSGLRLGECLGLQWRDIDLNKKTIKVHQKLVMGSSSHIEQGAKTENGIRIVDIPKMLVDFLKEQPPHNDDDFVVTTVNGKLMTSIGWRRLWDSYLKTLNITYGDFSTLENKPKSKYQKGVPFVIERFTAHYLRHTHATNLFYAGKDLLYIQQQLGHAKPETTLNIYTHYVKILRNSNKKQAKIINLDNYLKDVKNSKLISC